MNESINQFYNKISKKLALVSAYCEDESIEKIIKSCRLKPISIFSEDFDRKTFLEPIWIDEFGHSILIKNKKIKIDKKHKIKQNSTDIFKNNSLDFIISHSKKALIGILKDSNDFVLILKGSDSFYRGYHYLAGRLTLASPLTPGLQMIRHLEKLKDGAHKEIKTKSEIKDLKDFEWIVTSLPANKEVLTVIDANSKLRNLFNNG